MAQIPSGPVVDSKVAFHLLRGQTLLRIAHQRSRHEPLLKREVRIVQDRARRRAELETAGRFQARVEMASRNPNDLHDALPVLALSRRFARNKLRDVLAATHGAFNALRPANGFEVSHTCLGSSEALGYVDQRGRVLHSSSMR